MSDPLAWALQHARRQTLALAGDIAAEHYCSQAQPGEHHPTWILGHLLLSDSYLLYLLNVYALPDDFSALLQKYGPGATPTPRVSEYDAKQQLIERLVATGESRAAAVRQLTEADLARPNPDSILVRTQPTLGHHVHALVFHEGYHTGQLSSWRKAHGLAASEWVFAPEPRPRLSNDLFPKRPA